MNETLNIAKSLLDSNPKVIDNYTKINCMKINLLNKLGKNDEIKEILAEQKRIIEKYQ